LKKKGPWRRQQGGGKKETEAISRIEEDKKRVLAIGPREVWKGSSTWHQRGKTNEKGDWRKRKKN